MITDVEPESWCLYSFVKKIIFLIFLKRIIKKRKFSQKKKKKEQKRERKEKKKRCRKRIAFAALELTAPPEKQTLF